MMRKSTVLALYASFVLLVAAVSSNAGTIGNWDGSDRTWNHTQFSDLHALLTANGHVIAADAPITAAHLAGYDLFVIGEALSTPTATEMSALADYVMGGGALLVFNDGSGLGDTGGNGIFAGLGTTMSFGGDASGSLILGGSYATEGPPYDLVGQNLETTMGTAIGGGNDLAGTYIRYESIGRGYVFGFGDRSDHDYFAPSASNTNGQLFLNLAERSATPEPGTLVLLGLGLVGLGVVVRRRR